MKVRSCTWLLALLLAVFSSAYSEPSSNVVEMYCDEAVAYCDKGWQLLDEERPSEAIPFFNLAISLEPTCCDAWMGRGFAYFDTGDRQQALEDFTVDIHLRPTNARSYYRRGVVYEELENREAALEDYKKAVFLDGELLRNILRWYKPN